MCDREGGREREKVRGVRGCKRKRECVREAYASQTEADKEKCLSRAAGTHHMPQISLKRVCVCVCALLCALMQACAACVCVCVCVSEGMHCRFWKWLNKVPVTESPVGKKEQTEVL